MLNKAHSERMYTAMEFMSYTGDVNIADARYELIDGYIYMMSAPSLTHNRIVKFIYEQFAAHFKAGACEVFILDVDVFLYDEKRKAENSKDDCVNVYKPDVFVVCDKQKMKKNGIEGAPDLVIEVVSESNWHNDYVYKLNSYMRYGVKEYWIVDYNANRIAVYVNAPDGVMKIYSFSDVVKSDIFNGLQVDFSEFGGEK